MISCSRSMVAVCLFVFHGVALAYIGDLSCIEIDKTDPRLASMRTDVRSLERAHAIDEHQVYELLGKHHVFPDALLSLYCTELNADPSLDGSERRKLYNDFSAKLDIAFWGDRPRSSHQSKATGWRLRLRSPGRSVWGRLSRTFRCQSSLQPTGKRPIRNCLQ